MRTPAEIAFRLRQEAANMRLYLRPPGRSPAFRKMGLPEPGSVGTRLRGRKLAEEIEAVAEKVLARQIPLLGYEIDVGREIHWRRDYLNGRETAAVHFRKIPYLDFARAGDHKIIWELNRHQHLVVLAQAYVLTGRTDFLDEIAVQMESWMDQNPVCRGINWASALEVAFRALSWIWIQHLAGDRLSERWRVALYHHGCYLEHNLSIYFSPNTHLQGEALALHALGLLFGVERWRQRGASLMAQMIEEHVHPDGGHFEQSSYYHVYATDMFLFHAVLEPVAEAYKQGLRRMARYLWALDGSGELPFFGDDDGGRLFYPFGDRNKFARGTLAACAAFLGDTPSDGEERDLDEVAVWWLGDRAKVRPRANRESEIFRDTGVATMVEGDVELIASVRAFGRGSAGHSHAHALQFTLRRRGEAVLIDPGTYTYVGDPKWRAWFRGTAAHNTIRIDGLDQADQAGPFRWVNPAETEILDWSARPWRLHARVRYRGLTHERRVIFSEDAVWVVDDVAGTGRHKVEQFWHPAGAVEKVGDRAVALRGGVRLVSSHDVAMEEGWWSPVPGVRNAGVMVRVGVEAELPLRIATVFDLRGTGEGVTIGEGRVGMGDRSVEL